MPSLSVSPSQVTAIGLAAILLASAIGKARDLGGFASILRTTYGLPGAVVRPIAGAVPALEALIAGLLVWGPAHQAGLAFAAVLFGSLMATSGYAWASGRSGPCGCSGTSERSRLGAGTVIRSASLGMIAVVAFGVETAINRDTWVNVPPGLAVMVLMAAALTLLAVGMAWRLRLAMRQR